ncbi:unnamed protein product [Choristocarpus tenellus]
MSEVWVKQSLDVHRSTHVLLVPLGNIPYDAYNKYCNIIRRYSSIPMQNLTAPGDWNRTNSALKHFNWSEGCFSFRFTDGDVSDSALSEWEDFQGYRRVLGAIGIVHFPSCEGADFHDLERQFQAVVAGHRHIRACRIFAFGHAFELGAYPDIIDPQRDIVFPPEQKFEGGGSTTELHMAVSLYDVAVSIIKELAGDIRDWTTPSSLGVAAARAIGFVGTSTNGSSPAKSPMPPLSTPQDREAISESKTSKRRQGRLHKWIGDMCLLAGSPKDALEHYSQSMAETKSSDPLWYVGCLEGFAACLVAMSDPEHPTVHGDQALALLRDMARDNKDLDRASQATTSSTWMVLAKGIIVEKIQEALSVLSRYSAFGCLEVELCFKAARFHASALPEPRCDEALEMLLRGLSMPDMSGQAQVEGSIEAAIVCESMGLKRKAALFSHLAAMLCVEHETYATAHMLARAAAEGYGVSFSASIPETLRGNGRGGAEGTRGRWQETVGQGSGTRSMHRRGMASLSNFEWMWSGTVVPMGWVVLRKQLLQYLLVVSARCGDVGASSSYFASLVRILATMEGERRKAWKFASNQAVPLSTNESRGHSPLPRPLLIDALGSMSSSSNIGLPSTAAKDGRISWGERMMRRGSVDQSSAMLPPSSAPGGIGGSFGSGGSTHPNSPLQRMESIASEFLASAAQQQPPLSLSSKRSRKISLPKV